ncbi:hypothetical protein PO431_19155, partial [Escherichia coli]
EKRVFLVILFTSFSGSLVSRIPGAVQKEGQSLVVTGFDQNNTTTSKAGTFTPANPLFGGSQTGKNERSTLVIIITPTFPSGGNNG